MATTKAKVRTKGEKTAIAVLRPLTAFNQLTWRHTFAKNSPKKKNVGLGVLLVIAGIFVVWPIAIALLGVVFLLTCVLGWVMDLAMFFKEEDDSDLRKRLAGFRWLSVVTTVLGAGVLAVAFPVTAPAGALIAMVAVTARLAAASGFAKPYTEHVARSFVAMRDGEPRGSWQLLVAGVAFLVPGAALGMQALSQPDVIDGQLAVPAEVAGSVVLGLAATSVLLAVVAGAIVARRLKKEFGASKQYREALREALMVVFNQLSKGAQAQFLEAEQQGTLKMEQKGAEWEITLPTHLLPALRNRAELDMQFRQELNDGDFRFMVTQVWPKHAPKKIAIGPLDANEERIRRNLYASGGTEEAGGLAKGLTMDDPGFDDPNGMEEPLPRGYTVDDLDDWDKTAAIAAKFAELGLQLVGFNRASRKCIVEAEATATPRARWKQLTTPAGSSERAIRQDAEMLARSDRAVVLDLDLVERRVFLSPMLPAVAKERETIATELKADLMKVRIAVTWSTEGRAESIEVETRAVSPDPEAARETWRKVINAIHGGSNGWLIHSDPVRAVTKLVYGEPRALPALVPVVDLLPSATGIDAWNQIPLGRDSRGGLVTWDMEAGVHALIVGPTGSGKSIQLLDIILNVLARGGDVAVIDGSPKRGADFMKVRDFTRAWADNPADASAVLEAVYAEGRRRADLVLEYGGASWHDIPADVRERERVVPLVAVVDEYAALTALRDIPKGADKDDPKVVAAQEVNAAKSNVMMVMDDITREMRFVGIRVVLGLQRGDASILSGFMRNNFPTKIQLKTPNMPLDPAGLRMMFPGEYGIAAEEEFRALDTGEPGLGVTAQEGGAVTGYRGGFIKAEGTAIPELIAALGIARPPLLMPPRVDALAGGATPAPRQSPAPVASSSDNDDWLL